MVDLNLPRSGLVQRAKGEFPGPHAQALVTSVLLLKPD